jgi:hypothetical protein
MVQVFNYMLALLLFLFYLIPNSYLEENKLHLHYNKAHAVNGVWENK